MGDAFANHMREVMPFAKVKKIKTPLILQTLLDESSELIKVTYHDNDYLLSSCGKVSVKEPEIIHEIHQEWLRPSLALTMNSLFKEVYSDKIENLLSGGRLLMPKPSRSTTITGLIE